MKNLYGNRQLTTDERGFIAIIALGIFALLMVFGIMVQSTVIDTFESIKNTNNYYDASDISGSTMEFLQLRMNSYDAGFNTVGVDGEINCEYNLDGEGAGQNNDVTWCPPAAMAGDNKVKVTLKVKGRAEPGENLRTENCKRNMFNEINDGCYVVPFPGTGDAGKNCNLYEPEFSPNGSVFVSQNIVGVDNLDQLDYSCNWNKLRFGSSLSDRVAIPLFYATGDANNPISNPFKDGDATTFWLRIRTPCLDGTVCADNERYVLNEQDGNSIIVQWQISGTCPKANNPGEQEECGLVAIPDMGADEFSGIDEVTINQMAEPSNNIILEDVNTFGFETNVHPSSEVRISEKLQEMTKPILTLFLSEALISDQETNIPHLEYQFLTNSPVGNPKSTIEVTVDVEGNVFTKTLIKEEQKPLIDFAVQN